MKAKISHLPSNCVLIRYFNVKLAIRVSLIWLSEKDSGNNQVKNTERSTTENKQADDTRRLEHEGNKDNLGKMGSRGGGARGACRVITGAEKTQGTKLTGLNTDFKNKLTSCHCLIGSAISPPKLLFDQNMN